MRTRSAWTHEAAPAAGIALLASVALLPTFDRSANPMDEGQLLAIAQRLLDGEALYRDVHTGIFPGVYWGTALLLGLFGENIVVTRIAQLALNAGVATTLWWLGRRVMGASWALLAPLLYVALVAFAFPVLSFVNYSSSAMALGLGALALLVRHLESGRTRHAVGCGILLGLCGAVKQNFGALAIAALGLAFVWAHRDQATGASGLRSRSFRSNGLAVLASGAAVGAAMLAVLAVQGALSGFFHQTMIAIFESQLTVYNDPIPPLLGPHPTDGRFVFLYTPSSLFNYLVRGETFLGLKISAAVGSASIRLVYGATLALLLAGAALLWADRADPDAARRRATRAVVLFATALFPGIFPLAIWAHLAFVLPPVLLIPGLVGDRVAARLPASGPARPAWTGLHAVLAVCAATVTLRISLDMMRWYDRPLGLERGTLRVDEHLEALLGEGTRFLTGCAPPGEPVFVAPFIPILYFLADRHNPTPYDLVIPGNVDGKEIVARLDASRTRCVVYSPKMYAQFEPFEELFPEVTHHLRSRFHPVRRIVAPDGSEWLGLVRDP